MLHNNHRIAHISELFQHLDKAVRISWVQTNRRLIEDIQRARKVAAERGCEVYALALATRQRVRGSVEHEISQTHIAQISQAVAHLGQEAFGTLFFVVVELYAPKKLNRLIYGHSHNISDVLTPELHIQRFGA